MKRISLGSLPALTLAIALALAVPATPYAQHADHDSAAHARGKPAILVHGMGNLHHPVSTRNDRAQKFFDQGLTSIYAFMHEDAVRSFNEAARLDPHLAMAHWGIALALGPNYNMEMETEAGRQALAAIRRAQSLAPNASQAERDYIDALAKRYTDIPDVDPKKPAVDYKDAMKALMQKYPDDLDAATLYADAMMVLRPWRLWSSDGKPAEGTEEIVAVLESVLRRDPEHIGANHLYIHAVEASPTPARAMASAERLKTLVPAAGHLVHMPAHILDRIGDYAGAAKANEVGAKADRAYIARNGVGDMYPMMYYSHNLHFLAYAYASMGRYRDAKAAAMQLAKHVGPAVKDVPMLEGFLPTPTLIDVRFEKWDAILKSPRPPVQMAASNVMWRFARVMAFSARGDAASAKEEQEMMARAAEGIPESAPFGNNRAIDVVKVAMLLADAQVAAASNDGAAALAKFAEASKADDALVYDEPAPWPLPVREYWGAFLLKSGDAARAEAVFREELDARPRGGRALYGLARALKAQQKPVEAVERQFRVAWKNADTELR